MYNKNNANNGTPHLKSLKNQNRIAALGRPAIKFLGGFNFCGRPNLALGSVLVQQTKQLQRKHSTTRQEQIIKKNTKQPPPPIFYFFLESMTESKVGSLLFR